MPALLSNTGISGEGKAMGNEEGKEFESGISYK
jgi:hypothetical protein